MTEQTNTQQATPKDADAKEPKGMPRYKLSEQAYINDRLYEAGTDIDFDGIPGHHMEPLNDAAKAMKKKHGKAYLDPILALTAVGGKE
nr:hypothetical protein [Herbaspirillum sp. ASV7]